MFLRKLRLFYAFCLCISLTVAHADQHLTDAAANHSKPTATVKIRHQPDIYGYVEKAVLIDKNVILSAKLDTGAKSASLNAFDIHEVEKDNKAYLRFKVLDNAHEVEFTCEYIGKVSIKPRADEPLSSIKRPLVMMQVQIGNKIRNIPVNLTNRKHFNYPLLLGRDAIVAFDGIVDPSRAFLVKKPILIQPKHE